MIQVLHRAAGVLDALADGPAAFGAVRRRVGLHKATLANILRTLAALGYVRKRPDGTYAIGQGIVALGRAAVRAGSLAALAQRHADALAEDIGENVTVATLRDGQRYNLAAASADHSVTVSARLHERPSPYDTATGRALLAFADESSRAAVLARHPSPGRDWPEARTRRGLRQALAEIRDAGMAEVTTRDGQARMLAVPVLGPDGSAWAAIGTAVPAYRLGARRRREILAALRRAAERLGGALALRGEAGASPEGDVA